MGRAIVITSGKGGTGKTTAVAAIASCLAAMGHKTLCIDMDAGLKNLDLVLGVSDKISWDFNDVLENRVSLEEAAVEHPDIPNLFFLTAPLYTQPEAIDADRMAALLDTVREYYDFCLIDSPAGIGAGFKLAASAADEAIVIVSSVDAPALRDSQRVVIELEHLGVLNISLIVNKARRRLFRRTASTVDDIMDTAGIGLLGMVPDDEAVVVAAHMGKPLVLHTRHGAAVAFLRIAQRITGKKVPLGRYGSRLGKDWS